MATSYSIPLTRPYLPPGSEESVAAVLRSGYLTEGPVTRRLERAVADYVGSPYALAVTSCTTGLELALRALGIGHGDEVIVPDYTHPATAAAVAITGATVVLVDIDPGTMLLDYDATEDAITPATRAVLPVSQFGNPLDYDRLRQMGARHGLSIVEDAACALGAEFRGRRAGSQADIAVFSLHPRKFVTCGEGGMVVTAREDWATWMNSYKHFGAAQDVARPSARFVQVGTNFKLSDILAAVGLRQMQSADELLARRLALAERYDELLGDAAGIELPSTTPAGKHSRQTYCVFVKERDRIMAAMRGMGIEVQIGTYDLHRHPGYAPGANCRHHGALTQSSLAFERCLALPLYHEMTSGDQEAVVTTLRRQVAAGGRG